VFDPQQRWTERLMSAFAFVGICRGGGRRGLAGRHHAKAVALVRRVEAAKRDASSRAHTMTPAQRPAQFYHHDRPDRDQQVGKQAAGVASSLAERVPRRPAPPDATPPFAHATRVQSSVPGPSAKGHDDTIAAVELDMNLSRPDRGYLPSGLEDEPCAVRLAPGDALVVEGDERP
jgi:hypothetical protein